MFELERKTIDLCIKCMIEFGKLNNKKTLIKSGGGTDPMKPGNLQIFARC